MRRSEGATERGSMVLQTMVVAAVSLGVIVGLMQSAQRSQTLGMRGATASSFTERMLWAKLALADTITCAARLQWPSGKVPNGGIVDGSVIHGVTVQSGEGETILAPGLNADGILIKSVQIKFSVLGRSVKPLSGSTGPPPPYVPNVVQYESTSAGDYTLEPRFIGQVTVTAVRSGPGMGSAPMSDSFPVLISLQHGPQGDAVSFCSMQSQWMRLISGPPDSGGNLPPAASAKGALECIDRGGAPFPVTDPVAGKPPVTRYTCRFPITPVVNDCAQVLGQDIEKKHGEGWNKDTDANIQKPSGDTATYCY